MRVPFVPVVLLMALGACAPGDEPSRTVVTVEVFTVALPTTEDAGLAFVRSEGPLVGGVNPDQTAREIASQMTGEVELIHSTSWRWEPDGRIVLTYLAWGGEGSLSSGARPVPPFVPPGPTDPLHPRPREIGELDPLAHGLRHLAFLLRADQDGAIADAIGPRGCAELRRLQPTVAGEMP
jgi:hypothetical protein